MESWISHIFDQKMGSRSTALQPLVRLTALILTALVLSLIYDGPNWLTILISVILSIVILSFIIAYTHFAKEDPGALRSEKYVLERLKLERGQSEITGNTFRGEYKELKEDFRGKEDNE